MNKFIMLLSILSSSIISCTSDSAGRIIGESANKTQESEGVERIAVVDADPAQCPAGGKIYSVYLDLNDNHAIDSVEVPLSTQMVCNGTDGQNGSDGANGHSVQFAVFAAASEICPAGGSTLALAIDINDNGFYSVTDPNQQQMTACNGVSGTNGADAVLPAFTPMDVIFPCGNSVAHQEVLFRLNNGQVLASFSDNVNGFNTRLSLVGDGTYMNTDGSSCVFSLTTSPDGQTRSISWSGQIQKSWSISE